MPDLAVVLRSPFGIGTDLITLIDGLTGFGGTTVTNMVIDDDVRRRSSSLRASRPSPM